MDEVFGSLLLEWNGCDYELRSPFAFEGVGAEDDGGFADGNKNDSLP
jgi:hypothetical protein